MASDLGLGPPLRHSQAKVSFPLEQRTTLQGPGWVRPVEMMTGIYQGLGGGLYYESSWIRNAAGSGWERGDERCHICLFLQSRGFRNLTCKVLL